MSYRVRAVLALVVIVCVGALSSSAYADTRGLKFVDPQDEVPNPSGPTRADLKAGTLAYEQDYGSIGFEISFWESVYESPPGDLSQGYHVSVQFFDRIDDRCGDGSESSVVTMFVDLNTVIPSMEPYPATLYGLSRDDYFLERNAIFADGSGHVLDGFVSNPVLAGHDLRCATLTVRYQGYPPSATNMISYDRAGPFYFDGYAPAGEEAPSRTEDSRPAACQAAKRKLRVAKRKLGRARRSQGTHSIAKRRLRVLRSRAKVAKTRRHVRERC